MLKFAAIQASGDLLTLDCLPDSLHPGVPDAAPPPLGVMDLAYFTVSLLRVEEPDIYRRAYREMDKIVLETVLRHVKGNQVRA